MNLSLLRQACCILLSLYLFIACNQSRHVISSHADKDREFSQLREKKIDQLLSTAEELRGKAYRLGSAGPRAFDCSGLIRFVFDKINMTLPRKATDQAETGTAIQLKLVREGDLLFFGHRRVHHVAIVSKVKRGNIYITHATTSRGVVEEKLEDSEYWSSKLKVARRVIM